MRKPISFELSVLSLTKGLKIVLDSDEVEKLNSNSLFFCECLTLNSYLELVAEQY